MMMKLNLIICQLIVRVEGKISYSRLYNGFSRPTSTVDHISGYLKKRERLPFVRQLHIGFSSINSSRFELTDYL